MKKILAFGNPVYDLIVTPQIIRSDRVLSGCSTNACLAAAKLGEETVLVGTVGPDYDASLRQDLTARGVGFHLIASHQTGGFSLDYDARGDRKLTVLGIADPIPASPDLAEPCDFILFGPILGETSPELGKAILSQVNAPVMLDPQGTLRKIVDGKIVHEVTPAFVELARLSTVVKANEIETITVTGIDPRKDPEAAVKALHSTGCQIAVTTLAEAGSIIYDGQTYYRIPPYTTNAIDPTGAGDTYAAGFMVRYLENPGNLTVVGCFASAVASVMVENSGPDFPLTRSEADRRANILLGGRLDLVL
ncbi:MAG TPA: PfkB family carbohydrate kinase [Anaerolineaceae bacterium]